MKDNGLAFMLFVGVSVSVVLKFSVLKLNRIGFQLRNPVVYWKYWKLQGGKLRVAQGSRQEVVPARRW